jgi:potassium/chloride transporter 4/5/6
MQAIRDVYYKISVGESRKEGIGTFLGVFLPSLFTMIGALLYLPIGEILGNFGLIKTISVFVFCLILTLITALSLSSTASNMHVGEGGSYYMISRSFGLKTGAVMGLALYVAHALMACLCVLGFSDSIAQIIPGMSKQMIGIITILCLALFSSVSVGVAIRAQIVVFFLVLVSSFYFINGRHLDPIQENFLRTAFSFWGIFAILYPALIGIEAGAALSGDLKKPSFSLIVGTIGSTVVGFLFYVMISGVLWKQVPISVLQNDPEVLKNFIGSPIGLAGFWAATLASAMGCLLSAPRTLKAMAGDGVFPKWFEVFASKNEDSVRSATLFTACLVFLGSYFGSVQSVMPLLTIVILVVYGLLNLANATEEFISNSSWRPVLRISPYISIVGSLLCFSAVVLMDSGRALLALILLALIYLVVKKTVIESRLDDLRQTVLFSITRFAIYRLAFLKPSLRSWRPNFLVFSESASGQSALLNFTGAMAKGRGFVTLASVLKNSYADMDEIQKWEEVIQHNLKKKSLEALVEVTLADNIADGLRNIVSNYGLGPLVPNTVVIGQCNREEHFENYMQVLDIAKEAGRNILIFRSDVELKKLEKSEIDIWWDPQQKHNSELMILLANLLARHKEWGKAQITLKSVVSNESAQAQQKIYFEEFFQKSRLDMKCEVYLAEEGKEAREAVEKYSTRKGIVFASMKDCHVDYYKKLTADFKSIPTICFVTNHQEIDLHNLLN